jgi:hypothetical protein
MVGLVAVGCGANAMSPSGVALRTELAAGETRTSAVSGTAAPSPLRATVLVSAVVMPPPPPAAAGVEAGAALVLVDGEGVSSAGADPVLEGAAQFGAERVGCGGCVCHGFHDAPGMP